LPSILENFLDLENVSLGDPSKWLKNPRMTKVELPQNRRTRTIKTRILKAFSVISVHGLVKLGLSVLIARSPKVKGMNVTLTDESVSDYLWKLYNFYRFNEKW
jgi:hypothetical protein